MEYIVFALLIAGAIYVASKRNDGTSAVSAQESDSLIVDSKHQRYYIDGGLLGKAAGVDAYGFYKNFTPDTAFLNELSFGKTAGGAIGGLRIASSVVGAAVSSFQKGMYSGAVGGNGFYSPKQQDDGTIVALIKLADQGVLNRNELIKAVAAVLYNEGRGYSTLVQLDALGEPAFKNENERVCAAMLYQFFHRYTPPMANVKQLLVSHADKIA